MQLAAAAQNAEKCSESRSQRAVTRSPPRERRGARGNTRQSSTKIPAIGFGVDDEQKCEKCGAALCRKRAAPAAGRTARTKAFDSARPSVSVVNLSSPCEWLSRGLSLHYFVCLGDLF